MISAGMSPITRNMKSKLFTLLILLLGANIFSNAQLKRGNVLIGGDLAGFDLGLDDGNTFTMTLTPKAAWFIQDNVALGGYIDFGLTTIKDAGTTVNYGVGALGRYYFSKAEVDVRPTVFFGEANAGLEGVNYAGGDNNTGLGLGIGPGIAYFVNQNIALEALLKYNGIVGFGSSPTSSRLQLNLGFQVYLAGSKVKTEIKKL
jgi:hypothetical protein